MPDGNCSVNLAMDQVKRFVYLLDVLINKILTLFIPKAVFKNNLSDNKQENNVCGIIRICSAWHYSGYRLHRRTVGRGIRQTETRWYLASGPQ